MATFYVLLVYVGIFSSSVCTQQWA